MPQSSRKFSRGKPTAMALALSANRDRDNVLIELLDDGGGIEPDIARHDLLGRKCIKPFRIGDLMDIAARGKQA